MGALTPSNTPEQLPLAPLLGCVKTRLGTGFGSVGNGDP